MNLPIDRENTQANQSPENDPRLYMAAERTFLAWIRTGLSLMGFGFVIARFGVFLREMAHTQGRETAPGTGFSIWVGTGLIIAGILLNLISVIQHRRYIRALDANDFRSAFDTKFAMVIAVLLAIVGSSMAIYLMQLN